jgi:hypothetical protein
LKRDSSSATVSGINNQYLSDQGEAGPFLQQFEFGNSGNGVGPRYVADIRSNVSERGGDIGSIMVFLGPKRSHLRKDSHSESDEAPGKQ